MLVLFNSNKLKCNIIDISYKKIKINYLFLNNLYIIYVDLNYDSYLKNKILNYNLFSLILKEKYIKALFNLPNFSFLRNNQFLCIFVNNTTIFIDIIKNLNNKTFFFSYKNYLSNIVTNINILEEYNKYNMNFIYLQLILKKIKIKVIILLLFFLISLVNYIK